MKFKTAPLSDDSSALVNIEDCELPRGGGTLTIPEKDDDGRKIVAIENTAFANASLDVNTIKIPASVESIDRDAFGNNLTALHSIVVDKSNPNYANYASDDGVLFDKEIKTLIRYPQCKLGDKYEIPEGVETVCRNAFRYCENLEQLVIPASCVNLENWAFRNCFGLQKIVVAPNNPNYESIDGVLFRKVNEVFFKSIDGDFFGKVDGGDFKESPLILRHFPLGKRGKPYVVPPRTVEIEEWAFNWRGLIGITVPGSVKKIGQFAFWRCLSLECVEIQNGVETIGSCAFAQCAFDPESPFNDFWRGDDRGHIPRAVLNEYNRRNELTGLKKVKIAGSVKSVSEGMFSQCFLLVAAEIEEGVGAIEKFAFSGCKVLRSSTFDSSNESPGVFAIPGTVEMIGDGAFEHCSALETVEIKEGVKVIGSFAFAYCENLQNITIPESVEKIAIEAFAASPNVRLHVRAGSYAQRWADFYEYRYDIEQ